MPPTKRIPVTILSGFLGAGKTTILNNLLTNLENKRITIIVNDMSSINIDGQLIHRINDNKMIELSNGCICCTLKEDLLEQLLELNQLQSSDYIIIESTGIAEPLHIAETFAYFEYLLQQQQKSNKPIEFSTSRNVTLPMPKTSSLSPSSSCKIQLDTMITVIDLQTFLYYYSSSEISNEQCTTSTVPADPTPPEETVNSSSSTPTSQTPSSHSHAHIPSNERTLSHLLIDQIQFANILILNKSDLVTTEQKHDIEGIIKDLNPHATILYSSFGQNLPIKKLFNTKLFSYREAEQHHEWFQTEWGISSSTPETIEYDITSITFQSHSKPFHPQRLFDFYSKYKFSSPASSTSSSPSSSSSSSQQPRLLRSKGFIWLPFDHSHYYLLHHTGGSLSIQQKDLWWICKDSSQWPQSKEFQTEVGYLLSGDKAVKYGDRGNILILIGQHISETKWNEIRQELTDCLFSIEEMNDMNGNEDKEEWMRRWKETNPLKEIQNISPLESNGGGGDERSGSAVEEQEEDHEKEDMEEKDGDDDDAEGEEEEAAAVKEKKKRKGTRKRNEKTQKKRQK